jgi:hypothetical protein
MNNLIKSLNSINKFSKKIIVYSSIAVLIACVVSIGIIMYNTMFTSEMALYSIGTELLKKSLVVLAEFCIAALVFDLIYRILSNLE